MSFVRGDTCYIFESNIHVRQAKVISRQGKYYTIQLVGSCGAIRLPESRLFKTEEEAKSSKKSDVKVENQMTPIEYIDVFEGRRTNRNTYS